MIAARDQPPLCPQSGGAGLPDVYGFNSGPGNEDCLFLNVYAPPGAKDLPVFVWIRKPIRVRQGLTVWSVFMLRALTPR